MTDKSNLAGQRLLELLFCNSAEDLKGIDSRDLVKAAFKINGPLGQNHFLPDPSDEAFFGDAAATAVNFVEKNLDDISACADLPCLIGINEEEGDFLLGH